jgi:hypothetical protein
MAVCSIANIALRNRESFIGLRSTADPGHIRSDLHRRIGHDLERNLSEFCLFWQVIATTRDLHLMFCVPKDECPLFGIFLSAFFVPAAVLQPLKLRDCY